ncbi:hypothetical protein QTO34_000291 [Cnephaeus nilssonii]|uniref:Uncharacterized protein n=1 Tax=Cnephaeus nilssonii TaxID=3371016 RepID=A0AA40IBA8_CNENI|nr:hypothetical protein QTO34_000291 [Eptesicus nilssonii]
MGRQRNSPHMKEKQASPEKEANEMKADNLSEKEFREMVIRWLKRMEDKFDNMSKNQEEMKKNQEEIKNDIAAVKNSIGSIKSRLEEEEDRISELEDKVIVSNTAVNINTKQIIIVDYAGRTKGPVGASSTSTAAHCQRHITNAHHVLCRPLVISTCHKNNSETMWILATERNQQDYSSHEDRKEAVQRWKTLTSPCHTSSQQL